MSKYVIFFGKKLPSNFSKYKVPDPHFHKKNWPISTAIFVRQISLVTDSVTLCYFGVVSHMVL